MADDDSQSSSLDPLFTQAVQQTESANNPNAISSKGAVGLMQTMPTTLTNPGYGVTPAQNDSPQEKKRVGVDYLQAMNNKYQDPNLALIAYNYGPGNTDKWIANGADTSKLPDETRNYVTSVNKNYQQLKVDQLPKGTQYAQNDAIQSDATTDGDRLVVNIPNIHGNQKNTSITTPDPTDPFATARADLASKAVQNTAPSTNNASSANTAVPDPTDPFATARATIAQTKAAQTAKEPPVSTDEDLLKTIPSAVAKGVGILPQLPAMGGNAIANSLGYATGKILGVPPEMQNKLSNINPFFTGNTLPDALIQSGKAIATGNPGEQNPLSGDILYNPQTTSGKLLQAGIEGGIAGPVAGGAGVPSALAGIAGEGASQALPNNPIAPLIAGGLTYAGGKGISNALTPTALPADQATVIKNAENDFGIKTPASAMTNGSNAIERLASKSDNQDLTGQVNKTTNDLMGANDNGEGHTVVNQKSYLDAAKNNSAAYDKVFADIGNIPIDKQIVPILQEVENGGNSARLKSVVDSIQSKLNPDGTLPADAYKELTKVGANGKASVLQQIASSPTETDAAIAAQNILGHLDTALTEHATPEQQATLNAIDTRYKTQKAMEPVARQVGAGSQATIPTIQNVLNKEFSSINNSALPPIEFSNYLNTINPGSKTTGGFPGIKNTPERGGNALSNSEYAAAVASGNPYLAFAPLLQKGVGIAASKAASKYINTDWYKNRLLENAQ